MSTPAIPAAASTALSALNIHPHGHGHKHDGLALDSLTDSSSNPAAQTPASGSTQSLFGRLLNTLEQVAGIQLTAPAPSSRTAATTTPASPSPLQASGAKINVTA
jgi:hypothetical protein